MKQRLWITIALAGTLYAPGLLLAQTAHDRLTRPQSAANPAASPGNVLPNADSALPSRRIPGLVPPHKDESHPIKPGEAWPRSKPSTTPRLTPLSEPDAQDKGQDKAPLEKVQPLQTDIP